MGRELNILCKGIRPSHKGIRLKAKLLEGEVVLVLANKTEFWKYNPVITCDSALQAMHILMGDNPYVFDYWGAMYYREEE